MADVCTCGESRVHVVMERQTLDGATVQVWSDGAVSGRMGWGVVQEPGRSERGREERRLAARAVADELCLYEAREVRAVLEVARRASRRALGLPDPEVTVRRAVAAACG